MPVRRLIVTAGRIGNGVRIPDRTAAVMPSDAQYAIGDNPRRPRGAMRLSQKTCLRIAYRFFGLKRDMFLVRARLRVFRQRAALVILCIHGIYRIMAGMSRFLCVPGKPSFSRHRRIGAERADAGWYPAAARCGSRQPTGSAVPDGRRLSPCPPWARPGFGFAGNRGLSVF